MLRFGLILAEFGQKMTETGKRRFFYGWVIVAMGFSIQAVLGGGVYYAFGVFFPTMIAELGYSRGEGSVAFSISVLMSGFAAPLVGMAITRFGVRRVMGAGNVLLVLGLALMSRVTEAWHLYLIYGGMIGIAMVSAGFICVMTLANNWFIKRRGLALALCMAGVGVGTVILAPVNRALIESIGWRQAWLVMAGVAFIFALLPAILLARARPEDRGQLPDGAAFPEGEEREEQAASGVVAPVDWEAKAALKTPAFWLLVIFGTANFFTLNIVSTHQVAHLEDIGISPVAAAGAIGLLVGVSTLGRVFGGVLGDRFEPRYVAAVAVALEVVGLIIFTNARMLPLIYVYVVIYGLSIGALIVLSPAIIGAFFGRKHYSTILGMSNAVSTLVAAAGPVFAGFVFDAAGSYLVPLVTATIFCAVGGVCVLLARPPRP
jgi:MFS family permease